MGDNPTEGKGSAEDCGHEWQCLSQEILQELCEWPRSCEGKSKVSMATDMCALAESVRVAGGGWRVAGDGWRVTGGGYGRTVTYGTGMASSSPLALTRVKSLLVNAFSVTIDSTNDCSMRASTMLPMRPP
jgi:hypothetical protein